MDTMYALGKVGERGSHPETGRDLDPSSASKHALKAGSALLLL